MKLSNNNLSCNGLPGLSYFFQKVDSKMCFTADLYLFSPTRDSLVIECVVTLLFDVFLLSCTLLYSLCRYLSIIFRLKYQKILLDYYPFATLHNEVCFCRPWDQLEPLVSSWSSFKLSLIAALSVSSSH